MHFWGSERHYRCTPGVKAGSLMYFWTADVVDRCTSRIQFDFIDALFDFDDTLSMHLCHSFWDHRCTFGFSTHFIDALVPFFLRSSMHFWISNTLHRCTWRLEVRWWMLVGFDIPSSHTLMIWLTVHWCLFLIGSVWQVRPFLPSDVMEVRGTLGIDGETRFETVHQCSWRLEVHWS